MAQMEMLRRAIVRKPRGHRKKCFSRHREENHVNRPRWEAPQEGKAAKYRPQERNAKITKDRKPLQLFGLYD